MMMRLLDRIDHAKGLARDAGGDTAHVDIDPAGADEMEAARHESRHDYLRHAPYDVWLNMAKCDGTPFVERLRKGGNLGQGCAVFSFL